MTVGTHLETFRGEVETAIRVFYAYEAIGKLLSEQQYVNLANNNADFWIIFLSSAQTKLFIALGRLYDDSNDAFSFQSFIKTCRENIEEFGRESFEKRRLSDYATRPDWLDGYLSDTYFGKVEDIDALAMEIIVGHAKRATIRCSCNPGQNRCKASVIRFSQKLPSPT